jgi:hypothetical protein
MEGEEVVRSLLDASPLVGHGGNVDLLESIHRSELQLKLLQGEIVILGLVLTPELIGISHVSLYLPRRTAVHPFCQIKIIL